MTTPATFPPTFSISLFTLLRSSIFVCLYAATINVESAYLAKTTESVTKLHGVPSKIIRSNEFFKLSTSIFICSEVNNSEGFGGTLPDEIRYKFSITVC